MFFARGSLPVVKHVRSGLQKHFHTEKSYLCLITFKLHPKTPLPSSKDHRGLNDGAGVGWGV